MCKIFYQQPRLILISFSSNSYKMDYGLRQQTKGILYFYKYFYFWLP